MFLGPLGMLVGAILIIGGPLASLGRLARVFSDLKAIEYDDKKLRLHPLGSSRTLNWREVTAIEVYTLTQYVWGFIPVSKQHSIRISHTGGVLGTARISIPFNLLAMDKGTVITRLADMEKMRGGDGYVTGGALVSRQSMAAALSPTGEDRAPASDFDADAVMARYLARREAEAQTPEAPAPQMPPRVAGFGRKRA